jgi:hypothetical protein
MITMVRHRVRARPVSEQGRLAYGGYMELSYDPASPYEVKLAETGPDAGEVVFARDLLIAALNGDPAGEGEVRARLRYLRGARHTLLVLTVPGADGPLEFGLCDTAVVRFVRDTTALVPAGDEWRYVQVGDTVAEFLGQAA